MQFFRVISALSLLIPLSLNAQKPGGPAGPHTVTLDVAVTDKAGKLIPGLQQQDFTLLDDRQPKRLRSFRAVNLDAGTPAPPVEMVLVVDDINANILKMDRQREGVKHFLLANGGSLPLPVSLVVVSDDGMSQPVPASRNGKTLAAALDAHPTGLRDVRRSSLQGAADRFRLSLDALDRITAQEAAKPGRKLIVWVSPGWPLLANSAPDTTSKNQEQLFHQIVGLSTAMRDGHITLYHVDGRGLAGSDVMEFSQYQQYVSGVKSPSQAYPPNLALGVLAVQSGGLVLNQSNDLPAMLASEIAQSANDARAFYVIQFDAANADHGNEYHALQVKLDKPGVTARTRTGYYAQP